MKNRKTEMMIRKRKPAVFGALLAVLLCFAGIWAITEAADTVTAEGTFGTITWTLYEDGTLYFAPADGVSGTFDDSQTGAAAIPWYSYRASITKVESAQGISAGTSLDYFFCSLSNVAELDLSGWDLGNVTSASYTFYDCSSLTDLDISGWDLNGVTSLYYTFYCCSSLTDLDVSGWDTSSVTTLAYAFYGCSSLADLDVSGWDTSSVKRLAYTFYNCSSLTDLNVSEWDTGSVTTMAYTFYGCSGLTDPDVSGWDTGSVTTLERTFGSCTALTGPDVSGWDTGSVTTMAYTFYKCSALTKLDLSGWDTSSATKRNGMFAGCSSLYSVTFGKNWTWGSNYTSVDTGALPTPSASVSTGSWIRLDDLGEAYGSLTPDTLASEWTSDYAGTWVWEYTYTITFNANGGSGSMSKQTLTAYTTSTLKANTFTRSGYTFAGWNTASDGSGEDYADEAQVYNLTQIAGGTVTLYAQWYIPSYTIRFDANGGSGDMEDQIMTIGISAELSANAFTNSPYTFAGWNTASDGSGDAFSDGEEVTDLTQEDGGVVILYAQWNDTAYTVTFDANGGSGSMEDQIMYIGSSAAISANAFKRTAYGFIGWNTQSDGSGEAYDDGESVSDLAEEAGDVITLFAQWERLEGYYISTDNFYDPDEWTDDETGEVTPACEVFPPSEYEGYWTKLSDTEWMYTFYVYDEDLSYYVFEAEADGYTGDYTILSPYYLADGTVVATITNTDDANPDYGSLQISKYLKNENGEMISDSASFTIRVTITDQDEKALSGTDLFGEYAFADGIGMISISNGETIVLDNIPEGYHYSVSEVSSGNYTASYTNQEGVITADEEDGTIQTEPVSIINTISAEPESVDITLEKKISGTYESADETYMFYLSMDSVTPGAAYAITYYSDEEQITAPDGSTEIVNASSSGSVSGAVILLKADQSAVIENVPVGASYAFYEAAGDYISSYRISDANGLGLIAGTSAENSETNMSLSTENETADSGEEITVVFTNFLDRTQDIILKKTVLNASGEETEDETAYEITVTFSGLDAYAVLYSDSGKITADDEGEAEVTVLITGGQSITFEDVPVGTVYRFTEAANDMIASYTITDSGSLGKIICSADENTDTQTALSTADEIVNEGEEVTVAFTNTDDGKKDQEITMLASSGGIGIYALIGGSLLLLLPAMILAKKRRL